MCIAATLMFWGGLLMFRVGFRGFLVGQWPMTDFHDEHNKVNQIHSEWTKQMVDYFQSRLNMLNGRG
jgi:hypothetical protein